MPRAKAVPASDHRAGWGRDCSLKGQSSRVWGRMEVSGDWDVDLWLSDGYLEKAVTVG